MKLKLELLSENDMMSHKRVSPSMQDLFDYSDEVDYTLFLTDEALSSSATEPPHLFTC
jgi:predicted solute-binding protein